jgi:hypothetical protein
VNASPSATLSAGSWKVPLATESATAMIALATKIASINQATRLERLRTAAPRLLTWSQTASRSP